MMSYMETEMINLPTDQSLKYLESTIDRRASKDVENRVAKARSKCRELSGVICDKKVPTNNRDENGAMGNGGEPVRTPEGWGNLGGSESGTDSDGYEKEKAGVVWPRQEKRRNREQQSGCRNEDGGEAL